MEEKKNIYNTGWGTFLAIFAVFTLIIVPYFTFIRNPFKLTEFLIAIVVMYGAVSFLLKYYNHISKKNT